MYIDVVVDAFRYAWDVVVLLGNQYVAVVGGKVSKSYYLDFWSLRLVNVDYLRCLCFLILPGRLSLDSVA
jgi:hypothetical protein